MAKRRVKRKKGKGFLSMFGLSGLGATNQGMFKSVDEATSPENIKEGVKHALVREAAFVGTNKLMSAIDAKKNPVTKFLGGVGMKVIGVVGEIFANNETIKAAASGVAQAGSNAFYKAVDPGNSMGLYGIVEDGQAAIMGLSGEDEVNGTDEIEGFDGIGVVDWDAYSVQGTEDEINGVEDEPVQGTEQMSGLNAIDVL